MAYFTSNFTDFFKELSKNNHNDWFHANKKILNKTLKNRS